MTRDFRMTFALSKEECEQVKRNAAWFAMTTSEFLRHVALGGTIDWQDKALRKKAQARRQEVAG